MIATYDQFIESKSARFQGSGFDVTDSDINPACKQFQKDVIRWNCRQGRAGDFLDCGMGKTLIQLETARLKARESGKPALILCPLAVAEQTIREAVKFSIDASIGQVDEQSDCDFDINVTNYEKLHKFEPDQFSSVTLDESSILKGDGKTRKALTERFGNHRFRLACTATPAPNDHMELGNHAEFLGVMQASVMLSQYFIHDGGDTSKWRLKGHAKQDFWNWVSSWAVAISHPKDLGYDEPGYDLPALKVSEHFVGDDQWFGRSGMAVSATNRFEVKRRSLEERCNAVADIVNSDDDCWVVWVDTNDESKLLGKLIKGSVTVEGSDKPQVKSERLNGFSKGNHRAMVTKASIGGFGLNWQHCHKTTFFASYSFEDWYQAVRRLWRFGQEYPVEAHLFMSQDEHGILTSLKRKQADFESMAREMGVLMREGMLSSLYGRSPLRKYAADKALVLPEWV